MIMYTSFKVWRLYTYNSFFQVLANKYVAGLLLTGKLLRITLFVYFLNLLLKNSVGFNGFSREQIIFFYLSYNLLDTLAQMFFREVYRFRQLVITGGLDQILTRPVHPLIRVLLGGTDLLDVIMLCLLGLICLWYGTSHISMSLVSWFLYLMLILNGLVISAAFHIFVLGLGVITTSVDHFILIYRDLSSLMRIPVDVYTEPLRGLLTFAVPLGVMYTFPPKVLMGILSVENILISFALAFTLLFISLKFWYASLKNYQSAGG